MVALVVNHMIGISFNGPQLRNHKDPDKLHSLNNRQFRSRNVQSIHIGG
jgi:hypothetical protein